MPLVYLLPLQVEVGCYRCYCYEALTAGMLKCGRGVAGHGGRFRTWKVVILLHLSVIWLQPTSHSTHATGCCLLAASPSEAPYCIGQAGLLVLMYSAQALNVLGILSINMVRPPHLERSMRMRWPTRGAREGVYGPPHRLSSLWIHRRCLSGPAAR